MSRPASNTGVHWLYTEVAVPARGRLPLIRRKDADRIRGFVVLESGREVGIVAVPTPTKFRENSATNPGVAAPHEAGLSGDDALGMVKRQETPRSGLRSLIDRARVRLFGQPKVLDKQRWDELFEIGRGIPADERARLPRDGASNPDRYRRRPSHP